MHANGEDRKKTKAGFASAKNMFVFLILFRELKGLSFSVDLTAF